MCVIIIIITPPHASNTHHTPAGKKPYTAIAQYSTIEIEAKKIVPFEIPKGTRIKSNLPLYTTGPQKSARLVASILCSIA